MSYECPTSGEWTPDGCCTDWCGVTREDVRCFVRALLPPGELWSAEPPKKKIVEFADILADRFYEVVQRVCWMIRESDPCTAIDTLDDWLALYGAPPELCALAGGCNTPDVIEPYKREIACLFARLEYGEIPNCCFYKDLGAIFGVEVCCIPEFIPNSPLFDPAAESCGACDGVWPIYVSGVVNQPEHCPPIESDGCCDDTPMRYAESCSAETGDSLCERPPVPGRIPESGYLPVRVFFELSPPPGSDLVAQPNCMAAGDWLCLNPLVELTKCMIQFTLPVGVQACFIRAR